MRYLKRIVLGVAIGVAVTGGGKVAAGDYPPGATTPTVVVVEPSPPAAPATPASPAAPVTPTPAAPVLSGPLPATGSDSTNTLMIAGGALIAGTGIVIASKLRRRPATA